MWWWGDKLDLVLANQAKILNILNQLTKKENQMAIDLTTITANVAKNTDAANSAVTLLNNLTAIIKAIPPSSDPTTQAALDQLSATLDSNNTAIASAVVANTPVAP